MQIPPYVKTAIEMLNKGGYECYLVGGCVRDMLMGKEPHDYDLTTSARPEQMQQVFAECKVIETGIKHGTLTLLTDGGGVEITTYRIDGDYKDNRRPESVSFTPNLKEDLARRDFTVNAMAMDACGNLIDLYNGKDDIAAKLIRCVGDPERRFNEDGLRILRALRFAAVLGFTIHDETADAIHNLSHLLGSISAERVREELFKLICGPSAESVITQFAEVLLPFLPQISHKFLTEFTQLIGQLPPMPEVRLAALYALFSNEIGLDTAMSHLKTSNKQKKAAVDCCRIITAPPTDATQTAYTLGSVGESDFELYLTTAQICGKNINPTLQTLAALRERGACYTISQLAVTGNDLILEGIAKGKGVGDCLNLLFAAVAEGKVQNQKEKLLQYLKADCYESYPKGQ